MGRRGSAEHDPGIRHPSEEVIDDQLLVAATSLVVERASAETVAALSQAGIRAMLIKGPVQQQWLAAGGPSRASIDVDVLVDPARIAAAGAALSTLGYHAVPEVTPGVRQSSARWEARGRISVDLHDGLWGADGDVWDLLAGETEATMLADESVEIPNEPARCLIVALHAAHHGAGKEATMYDLDRAIAVADFASWERARDLARAVRAVTAFAAGLGLVPSGERLRADLGLDAPTLTDGLALEMATPTAGAPGYYWFSRQRGVRARARFVARKLVPPADFMRYKHPFARRGRVHLLLTYFYRPVWLARWAVPGLLGWRRTRARARSGTPSE